MILHHVVLHKLVSIPVMLPECTHIHVLSATLPVLDDMNPFRPLLVSDELGCSNNVVKAIGKGQGMKISSVPSFQLGIRLRSLCRDLRGGFHGGG